MRECGGRGWERRHLTLVMNIFQKNKHTTKYWIVAFSWSFSYILCSLVRDKKYLNYVFSEMFTDSLVNKSVNEIAVLKFVGVSFSCFVCDWALSEMTFCSEYHYQPLPVDNRDTVFHRRRSSVNFRGARHICTKNMYEKLSKCPNFTWFLPRKLS